NLGRRLLNGLRNRLHRPAFPQKNRMIVREWLSIFIYNIRQSRDPAIHGSGVAMGTGTEVAMQSAGVTLVKRDLAGIARARALSRATMRNIRQNLVLAFVYNVLGIPLAAGVLYPAFGLLLSPIVAAAR